MGIDLTVSGETKLTGLVGGSGITSSFSPRMHTASFSQKDQTHADGGFR